MPKSDMHCPTQGRRERRKGRHTRGDLSHDDLLFLLSILEGELQVTHCKHIHVLFQLINSKRAIKCTVTVTTAILRCRRKKNRCSTATFVTLGPRWGDRCVEVREDRFTSTCGPIWFRRTGGSASCFAQRLALGSAAAPGGCVQTTFCKGTKTQQ